LNINHPELAETMESALLNFGNLFCATNGLITSTIIEIDLIDAVMEKAKLFYGSVSVGNAELWLCWNLLDPSKCLMDNTRTKIAEFCISVYKNTGSEDLLSEFSWAIRNYLSEGTKLDIKIAILSHHKVTSYLCSKLQSALATSELDFSTLHNLMIITEYVVAAEDHDSVSPELTKVAVIITKGAT